MTMLSLREAAALIPGASVLGDETATFARVCTDSRTAGPGDLFVALKGERFDAHDFLPEVARRKVSAVLVSRSPGDWRLNALRVADTRAALGALAHGWRQRFTLPLVAVTGSNGKTTVKEMIASIFAAHVGEAARLATAGNLNNDVGLPLTLLRLSSAHRLAVVELGMNHPGETQQLARLAAPTVAVVNNAQREHQEFMTTVEAVALEHASVIHALPPEGVAVFPADDAYASIWRVAATGNPVLDFALHATRGEGAARSDEHVASAANTASAANAPGTPGTPAGAHAGVAPVAIGGVAVAGGVSSVAENVPAAATEGAFALTESVSVAIGASAGEDVSAVTKEVFAAATEGTAALTKSIPVAIEGASAAEDVSAITKEAFAAATEGAAALTKSIPVVIEGASITEGVSVVTKEAFAAATKRASALTENVPAAAVESVSAVAQNIPAAVTGTLSGNRLHIDTPRGALDVVLRAPGAHNARNALAASAAALAANVPLDAIRRGLEAFEPVKGRLQIKRAARGALAGASVIDDTYNANPDSARAAIDVLAQQPSPRVLVMGDMGEVGENGPAFHREVGAYARARGIDALYTLGDAARDMAAAFNDAGERAHTTHGARDGHGVHPAHPAHAARGARHAHHAAHVDEIVAALLAAGYGPTATILVKGSRFMQMERVVAALTSAQTGASHAPSGAH